MQLNLQLFGGRGAGSNKGGTGNGAGEERRLRGPKPKDGGIVYDKNGKLLGTIKDIKEKAQEKQKPTNARSTEYMNQAQLEREIQAREQKISRLENANKKYLDSQNARNSAYREAFPLGHGGSTTEQIRRAGRRNEIDARNANTFTDRKGQIDTLKKQVENMKNALNKVKGTGKTLAQINDERRRQAEQEAKTSGRQWTRNTIKSRYGSETEYTSGSYRIVTGGGVAFIYNNGERIGYTKKLATAKAYVEELEKKKKR